MEANIDKAGKEYWNNTWQESSLPNSFDPKLKRFDQWVSLQFHNYFVDLFKDMNTSKMDLLEIGCAKSIWLPYFAKEMNFKVTGLDYSPNGCELSRQILKKNNVSGEIICADLFEPPKDMLGKYDVIVSFGVVEHFKDTATCLKAISKFLKPGGLLITSVPNLVGWNGSIQKLVNQPVLDIHELIDTNRLKNEYQKAGLQVLKSEYFVSTNFGVCNLTGVPSSLSRFFKKIFLGILARISQFAWRVENVFGKIPASKAASPYLICIGRKPF